MSDETFYFSHGQQVAVTVIPMITGILSAFGSSCIVYIILSDHKNKLQKPYHRLLLGLSVSDISNSLRACISGVLTPSGTPGAWAAQGTQATCTAMGFLAQLGFISTLYSGCLALYFYLAIQPHRGNKTFWIEVAFHVVSILYPFATGILGVVLDLYNPVPLGVGCWVAAAPFGCLEDDAVECVRGDHADFYIWIFGGLPTILSALVILGCMMAVFLSVRHQTRKVEQRYSLSPQQNRSNKSKERIRQAGIQAGLYIGSCILTYVWVSAARLVENSADSTAFYAISLLSAIFYPLQGFWNFLMYFRPRYLQMKRKFPGATHWFLWCNLFVPEGQEPGAGRTVTRPASADSGTRLSKALGGGKPPINTIDMTGNAAHLQGIGDAAAPRRAAPGNASATRRSDVFDFPMDRRLHLSSLQTSQSEAPSEQNFSLEFDTPEDR